MVQFGDNLAVKTEASVSNSLSECNNTQNLQQKALTERITKLEKEYGLINQQIDETIDEGVRPRLQAKANRIFNEIKQVKSELDNL